MAGSDRDAQASMSPVWRRPLGLLAIFAVAVLPYLIYPSAFTAALAPIISGSLSVWWRSNSSGRQYPTSTESRSES